MSINKRIFLCLLLLLLVGGISLHLIHNSPKYIAQEKQKKEAQLVHEKDTKLPYTYLNNVIAQAGASCSVYYKSLDTGEVFYNFSGKMPAGALIRPYIATAVLQQVKDKDLKFNQVVKIDRKEHRPGSPDLEKLPDGSELTIQNLLESMMLHNDQTALAKLVELAGRDEINAYLLNAGYADTFLSANDFEKTEEDHEAKDQEHQISFTSVNDMVTFMERLYKGKCVSPEQDAYLLSLLQRQNDRQLLGALLPRDLQLAQVTADHGRVLNAAGIIYAREKYILVIMTDKALRPIETRKTMNQISSIIFNTVNDKEVFKK
jgi:beta-lactamase class A